MNPARKKKPLLIHVHWTNRQDLPEILHLEYLAYGEQAWTEKDFLNCLRMASVIGITATYVDKTVGFAIYELYKRKLRILNLVVHPDWRRQGIGSLIFHKMLHFSGRNRRSVTLSIDERNLGAQLFFKANAFKAERVVRDYYGEGVDSFAMRFLIDPKVFESVPPLRDNC